MPRHGRAILGDQRTALALTIEEEFGIQCAQRGRT
jgi:hypothetical protein